MAATNKTEHYELPIFVSSDIPTWLGDWNTTMGDIDEALYTLSQNTADVTKAYVDEQNDALDGKITALTTRVSNLETKVAQLQAALNNMVQYAESNSGITAGQYEKLGLYANE